MTSNPDINPETKVGRLLEHYPELENVLTEIAPEFKKLKNPLLRKTIARVTSLRQAALIAGIPASDLVNRLRVITGHPPLEPSGEEHADLMGDKPLWPGISEVEITYDATAQIRSGGMPLGEVMDKLAKLSPGQVMLLITPLLPAPLLEKAREKGFQTWTERKGSQLYHSFIKK